MDRNDCCDLCAVDDLAVQFCEAEAGASSRISNVKIVTAGFVAFAALRYTSGSFFDGASEWAWLMLWGAWLLCLAEGARTVPIWGHVERPSDASDQSSLHVRSVGRRLELS